MPKEGKGEVWERWGQLGGMYLRFVYAYPSITCPHMAANRRGSVVESKSSRLIGLWYTF